MRFVLDSTSNFLTIFVFYLNLSYFFRIFGNNMPDLKRIKELLDNSDSLESKVENFEIYLICEALEKTKGVVTHAAEDLKVKRTTLIEKMRRYEINANNYRE